MPLLLLLPVLLSGCRADVRPAATDAPTVRRVTDDLERVRELPAEVTRVVSLAPNLTEIVYAVGAGDKLVGVTTYCDYPAEARQVRKVGDTLKPNVENIIALRPQVVFVSTASQLETFAGALEEQGIVIFVTDPASLEGVYRSIQKVGEVLGQDERAGKLVEELRERVAGVEARTKDAPAVRTFVQLDKALYTIGRDSFLTDLLDKAGGVSVTRDLDKPYPKISRETALALDPEAIILSDSPGNTEPNEAFGNSSAVRGGRVHVVDADLISRPGPRIVEALERIARALHPGRFGE